MRPHPARRAVVVALFIATTAASCSKTPQSDSVLTQSTQLQPSASSSPPLNDSSNSAPITPATNAHLDAQEPSQHPLGGEWNDQVTPLQAADDLSERAYNEWQRRISACMSDRGFDYKPITYLDVSVPDLRRALNPLNETSALRYGYHTPDLPEVERDDNTDAAFARALDGSDADADNGCASQVYSDSYGNLTDYFDDIQALVNSLAAAVEGYDTPDQAQAAVADWSDCMATLGYDYDSPAEPRQEFQSQPSVSPSELAARSADLACDRSTKLTERQSAWERERFEQWKDETAQTWAEVDNAAQQASEQLAEAENQPDSSL